MQEQLLLPLNDYYITININYTNLNGKNNIHLFYYDFRLNFDKHFKPNEKVII